MAEQGAWSERSRAHPQPRLLAIGADDAHLEQIRVRLHDAEPAGVLSHLGLAHVVEAKDAFPRTMLVQHHHPDALVGIDPLTVRVLRHDPDDGSWQLVERSGATVGLDYAWAEISGPGVYMPVGLPRDRLLLQTLRALAAVRRGRYGDDEQRAAALRAAVALLVEAPEEDVEEFRAVMATLEVKTGVGPFGPRDVIPGRGGHLRPFPFPGGIGLEELRERLRRLAEHRASFAEEVLLDNADVETQHQAPWPMAASELPLSERLDRTAIANLRLLRFRPRDLPTRLFPWPPFWPPLGWPPPWLFNQDWPMYHHDASHSGAASGLSDINGSTVNRLVLHKRVDLGDGGNICTIPSIVGGKVYIGTSNISGGGGRLYRIDLVAGTVDNPPGPYATPSRLPAYIDGIGGSPAISNGRVYFTDVPGRVWCIDAATFAHIWTTDLRNQDLGQNQPVQNPNADSWASPVVANGRVYVGCGEGEQGAFGFVYCLDASDGKVLWLFCTAQFQGGVNNAPNVIPASTANGLSAAQLAALGPGFTTHADPTRGASVWSSVAYDASLNRVFVGTGNLAEGTAPPPGAVDGNYGSGVLSLDATTGAFAGFFQPTPADSYHPADSDIDVCGSPTLFTRNGRRVLAIGSKSGSLMLLDAQTMTPAAGPRNLLPRAGGDGFRADGSTPLAAVDPGGAGGGENYFGIFGTPAFHALSNTLFVGIGGYGGAIDITSTPFMRALRGSDLTDAWNTAVDANNVKKYTVPVPPMYTTPGECGLSSPAVVNDLVFVATSTRGLYALDVATGLCKWTAAGTIGTGPVGWDTVMMGPAISGDYVVVGCDDSVYIYTLRRWIWPPWPPWPRPWPPVVGPWPPFPWPWPWPPPPPPPDPWEELGPELNPAEFGGLAAEEESPG